MSRPVRQSCPRRPANSPASKSQIKQPEQSTEGRHLKKGYRMPSVQRSDLRQLFVDTLNIGPEVDVEELKYNSIKAWDSVAHMALVAALETEFDVMLDTDEVLDLSSFKKCVEILGKYGLEIVA